MKKFKKYLLFTLAIAFLSEIYFYPFSSSLRFSVGVIALSLFLLMREEISELKLSFLCGSAVFIIRNILAMFFKTMAVKEAVILNFPAMLYYMSYGLLAFSTKVRKDKENLVKTIFLLTIIDSSSNVLEALVRNNVSFNIIQIIFLVGIIRSFIAYFIYWFYKKQELFILAREHQKRYSQLNKLVSDIQAEMFYLKKSMKDIERVMSKSYSLYETYKDNEELQEETLNISREVHEIKKDYYRVIRGFEAFLKDFENDDTMRLSDIFAIIRDNTIRYLKENNKEIKISFNYADNFILKTYYSLFSMLNNLIINSIDASDDGDTIKIVQLSDEENIYFKVIDTGEGIDKELLPYIYNPGFTTKYDVITGKPSTGIGLSHIKNIIEDLEGNIEIKSRPNIGTTVELAIPKKSLIG
ncbi:ATP-binding protein [Paramaledivibacter caminithermalis]|jgi:two-component system sensor histidine kinase YcbA|uniref:histidine kinase n=1 Tax=Paramaledivibacter caminithermalis (strain DSM 15212 / CIP 107654 / DViRD3) TaxID=1121301 RepID=A0A1M6QW61_PARC5|nr:ATP-binding protein [Paramaledivibacter caminithermalis]SHK24435.1 two-component system, sensor histidine kinase YcbA [Paramaledivibacter caminithermalis DSM 15212]